jgi:hypothetical protein
VLPLSLCEHQPFTPLWPNAFLRSRDQPTKGGRKVSVTSISRVKGERRSQELELGTCTVLVNLSNGHRVYCTIPTLYVHCCTASGTTSLLPTHKKFISRRVQYAPLSAQVRKESCKRAGPKSHTRCSVARRHSAVSHLV